VARSTRTFGWSIALLLATAWIGWFWLLPDEPSGKRRAPREPAPREADAPAPSPGRARVPPTGRPAATPAYPGAPAGVCAPRARRECQAGDVYWLDACGRRGDKADECGARLCKGDACEPTDELACAGLPLEGICVGDVVRGCLSGWLFERDCRALGKRCVMSDEGAVCRKPSEDDCERFGKLPRCEGGKLIACLDGKRIVRSCSALNASCEVLPQTNVAACVDNRELSAPPRERDPCGPCGCLDGEQPAFTDELCNGRDDDGDSFVDEDVGCEPLAVIAYVVTDSAGGSSYTREDIELEIARVNTVFARRETGLPLTVTLASIVDLATPEYLRVDDDNFGALLHELTERAAASASLQVPVVFTDEVLTEDAPKAGISTIPNGTCGGIRRAQTPQPALGMVVVAKRRAPTTVAHELGHFLGLCHTHEADPAAVVQTASYRDARGQGFRTTCESTCKLKDDGMCDTPHDPGPERCSYDTQCYAHCSAGGAPSTNNLMSYYTECRDRLTAAQSIEVARSRSLLEGFHRCAVRGPCPCVPGAPAACPEQMTCRPNAAGLFACSLDGAFFEGEGCRAHEQCGAGLACAAGRCAALPEQW
jgi:hypothetical protein